MMMPRGPSRENWQGRSRRSYLRYPPLISGHDKKNLDSESNHGQPADSGSGVSTAPQTNPTLRLWTERSYANRSSMDLDGPFFLEPFKS